MSENTDRLVVEVKKADGTPVKKITDVPVTDLIEEQPQPDKPHAEIQPRNIIAKKGETVQLNASNSKNYTRILWKVSPKLVIKDGIKDQVIVNVILPNTIESGLNVDLGVQNDQLEEDIDSIEITMEDDTQPGGEIVRLNPISITVPNADPGKGPEAVNDDDPETRCSFPGKGTALTFKFGPEVQSIDHALVNCWHLDRKYFYDVGSQSFECPAGRTATTDVKHDLKSLNLNPAEVKVIGQGNDGSDYNSFRKWHFYGTVKKLEPCQSGQCRDRNTNQCRTPNENEEIDSQGFCKIKEQPGNEVLVTRLIAFADNDTTTGAKQVLDQIMKVPNVSKYLFVGDGPYSSRGTAWTNMMGTYFNTQEKMDKLLLYEGNHDGPASESAQTKKDIHAWYNRYTNDSGLWLHSEVVGNVFLLVMDTEDPDANFRRDQYNYVETELNKTDALVANGTINWIVAGSHKPWFTLKGGNNHDPYTSIRFLYKDMFKAKKVDKNIHGHNHNGQMLKPMLPNDSDVNGEGRQVFTLAPDGKTFDFDFEHGWLTDIVGFSGHEWNKINDGPGMVNTLHYRDGTGAGGSKKFGFEIIDFYYDEANKRHRMHTRDVDSDGVTQFEYNVIKTGAGGQPGGDNPVAKLELPATAQPNTTGLKANASASIADTVEITQTTSENINLRDTGEKWVKEFDVPDKQNFSIGIQAVAKKGTKQSIVQKIVQVISQQPGNYPVPTQWYYSSDQVIANNSGKLTSSKYVSNESPNQVLLPSGASGAKNHTISDGKITIDSGGGNGRLYWDYVKIPEMKANPKYGKSISFTGSFTLGQGENLSIKDGNHGTDGSIIETMDLVFGGLGLSLHKDEWQSKVEYNHDVSQGNEESGKYPGGKTLSTTKEQKFFVTIVAFDAENSVKLNVWLDFGDGSGWLHVCKDREWKAGTSSWKPPSGIPNGKDKQQILDGPAKIVRNHIWTRANSGNLPVWNIKIGIPI